MLVYQTLASAYVKSVPIMKRTSPGAPSRSPPPSPPLPPPPLPAASLAPLPPAPLPPAPLPPPPAAAPLSCDAHASTDFKNSATRSGALYKGDSGSSWRAGAGRWGWGWGCGCGEAGGQDIRSLYVQRSAEASARNALGPNPGSHDDRRVAAQRPLPVEAGRRALRAAQRAERRCIQGLAWSACFASDEGCVRLCGRPPEGGGRGGSWDV